MDGSIPTHMRAVLNGLIRLSKQNKGNILPPPQKDVEFGGGMSGRIQWQLDGGSETDLIIFCYIYV